MSEEHTHEFKNMGIINVLADPPELKRPPYTGEFMAFLVYTCDCGKQIPFEYGTRVSMRKKLKYLQEVINELKTR